MKKLKNWTLNFYFDNNWNTSCEFEIINKNNIKYINILDVDNLWKKGLLDICEYWYWTKCWGLIKCNSYNLYNWQCYNSRNWFEYNEYRLWLMSIYIAYIKWQYILLKDKSKIW